MRARSGGENCVAQRAVAVVYAFGRRSFRLGAEHSRDVCRHSEMADGAEGCPGVSVIPRYLQKEFLKVNAIGLAFVALCSYCPRIIIIFQPVRIGCPLP